MVEQQQRQGNGIFANDERCIQFLDVMQNLMEKTLQEAYRVAANLKNHEGPIAISFTPHIAERYRYTLDLIAVWPSNIIAAEEERAKQLSVHILDCYRHLVHVYRQDFGNAGSVHSFASFLHEVYKQLALLPEVRNGIYFQLFGWNRKGVIADAIRAALRATAGASPETWPALAKPAAPAPAFALAPAPAPATALLAPPPPPAPNTTKAMLLEPPPAFPATPKTPAPAPAPAPAKPTSTIAAAFGKAIEIDLTRPDLGPPPSRPPPTTKKN